MAPELPLNLTSFRAGQRVALAVSGGADSVALLRALAARRDGLGLVLSVIHVHHGLRGKEADEDEEFVRQLAESLHLPRRTMHGDVRARAHAEKEGLEEAARAVRYGCFRRLLEANEADSVATAHTLNDQAETVMMKLLRGAWTEGLGGIHPVVACGRGRIVRPMLGIERSAVEQFLRELGQGWRTDASNADPAFTRNRVRQVLMPALQAFNPQVTRQLARLSTLARDEEAWWEEELARVLPSLLLPGRATRGGGRRSSTHPGEGALAMEVARLRSQPLALRRRVLRAAAARLGSSLGFDQVELLLAMAGAAEPDALGFEPPRKAMLPGGLRAERSPRELRLERTAPERSDPELSDPELSAAGPPTPELREYVLPVPGSLIAAAYGLVVSAEVIAPGGTPGSPAELVLRPWQPGDKVFQRYSRGPKKVAEALDRLRISGPERRGWPVLASGREVLWMRGIVVDPAVLDRAGLRVQVRSADGLPPASAEPFAPR